uniref:PiggyBac transposable element-derived protein domain-containing protein n=1 Tax=Clastoptera arizonana TaxID=38151 RepID=A0A1B6E9D2_9HEMI
MTVWHVLRKCLHLKPYRYSLYKQLKTLIRHYGNKIAHRNFCVDMLNRVDDDKHFLDNIIFCDESSSHLSGKVNTHNCRIWGSENPHEILKHVRDGPKVNVFCALSKRKVCGPLFSKREPSMG